MKYKILHIPTGTYYAGISDIPSFSEDGFLGGAVFHSIKDVVFTIARILYYCKLKPAYFIIDGIFELMPILENELEIIEVEE